VGSATRKRHFLVEKGDGIAEVLLDYLPEKLDVRKLYKVHYLLQILRWLRLSLQLPKILVALQIERLKIFVPQFARSIQKL
jgi:hypothetical protein